MKKLLYITSPFPKPLDNGSNIRDYHILKFLSKKFQITLVGIVLDELDNEEYRLTGLPIYDVFPIKSYVGLKDILKHPMFPLWVINFTSEKLSRLIESTLIKRKYDAVHISHGYMAHYITPFLGNGSVLKVLDHHNIKTYMYNQMYSRERSLWRKIGYKGEYLKWKKFEQDYFHYFDIHLATSRIEEGILKTIVDKPVYLLPSGADHLYYKKKQWIPKRPVILFTGSLDYFPNAEGLYFFCKDCLPLIKKGVPDAVLQVVGRAPSYKTIRFLKKIKDVYCNFYVSDTRPYLYQSRVFVVPLMKGAGTRLKITEGLLAGIPIVSTTKGFEGLDLIPGEEILAADDPALFSKHVIDLLRDDNLARRIGENGYAKAMSRYTWEKTLLVLNTIYQGY